MPTPDSPAVPTPARPRAALTAVATVLTALALCATTLFLAPTAAAFGPKTAVLAYNDEGPRVKKVQRFLDVSPVSGWYGPITRHSVRVWKRNHDRGDNGWVGRKMWRIVQRSMDGGDGDRRRDKLNWPALAECESGGNPRAINPAGPYYGLYQFDLSTWRSVGGHGYPHHATPRHQTYRAKRLFAARGAAPWPVCGYKLFT